VPSGKERWTDHRKPLFARTRIRALGIGARLVPASTLYPFTNDRRLADRYITEVLSGSVGVNEAILQVGQHGLPFGGVGASGMGHYHGYEGFLTLSKLRPIFRQARISSIRAALLPPYGTRAQLALDVMYELRG